MLHDDWMKFLFFGKHAFLCNLYDKHSGREKREQSERENFYRNVSLSGEFRSGMLWRLFRRDDFNVLLTIL